MWPRCEMARSDGDAESEVADPVEVFLDGGGISKGLDSLRTREHPAPAATQATACGRAGCPCGTDVGLANQVVDLHGGGLAGQAGESPAAAVATGEDFGLAVRQKFELGHLNVRSKLKWA